MKPGHGRADYLLYVDKSVGGLHRIRSSWGRYGETALTYSFARRRVLRAVNDRSMSTAVGSTRHC